MKERCECIFRGHVQGVGFRYTTTRLARGFAVTGWVRNEADGTVRMVAEGERAELQRFVDAIAERMSGFIADAEVRWAEATGECAGFEVRR